jgi:predicted RNA polymerase sigma factor
VKRRAPQGAVFGSEEFCSPKRGLLSRCASIAREWAATLREHGRQEEAFEAFERAIQMSDRTAQRKN